jgi:hypothetical protein
VNLDVDIGGGRKGRIVVTEGADPTLLAEEFRMTHNLDSSVLPRLVEVISSNQQAYQVAKRGQAQLLQQSKAAPSRNDKHTVFGRQFR